MLLSDLIKKLTAIQYECEGGHPGIEKEVDLIFEPDHHEGEITDVQPVRAMGCGCWIGAEIHIRMK